MTDFCSYFDSAYMAKGVVCLHTLLERGPGSRMFLLCLDDNVLSAATRMPGVVPVRLSEVERYKPELLSIKAQRSKREYYATISPVLPQYLFDIFGMDKLFYTDADMAFWGDPGEIETVFGDKSIMVTDHGNPKAYRAGRFNVGILGYRNDVNCLEFLRWWQDKCLEWCEWRALPDGRCADQGYLNILYNNPDRFRNALSCPQPGINLGPWNIARHNVSMDNGRLRVDGRHNLVCYHYHEFHVTGPGSYSPTGWKHTDSDRKLVYEPYFSLIRRAMEGKLQEPKNG
jgi:hypothetical protein